MNIEFVVQLTLSNFYTTNKSILSPSLFGCEMFICNKWGDICLQIAIVMVLFVDKG